jgi:ribulose-phosphate 3-epimerase
MQRQIIPGIQERVFSEITTKIKQIEPFVDWVQIDVADGTLTSVESFRIPSAFKVLKTRLNLEVHLMTKETAGKVEDWIRAGFKRVIIHSESNNPQAVIEQVKNKAEIGFALDGPSPLSLLCPFIGIIDFVLIMMYKAGPSGQEFEPSQLEKVHLLRKRFPELPIEVDGGINIQTIALAEKAGANRFVVTSSIFNSPNIEGTIKLLQGDNRNHEANY